MLPLQPERKRQPAQRSRHPHALAHPTLLLAHRATRTTRALAIPSTASCSRAAGVVVVLDVSRLLVGVLALLAADAQDAEQGVEERAGAAEQAEQQQKQDAKDDADDDAGDGAAGKAVGDAGLSQRAVCACGHGGLERHCGRGRAGVCDDD